MNDGKLLGPTFERDLRESTHRALGKPVAAAGSLSGLQPRNNRQIVRIIGSAISKLAERPADGTTYSDAVVTCRNEPDGEWIDLGSCWAIDANGQTLAAGRRYSAFQSGDSTQTRPGAGSEETRSVFVTGMRCCTPGGNECNILCAPQLDNHAVCLSLTDLVVTHDGATVLDYPGPLKVTGFYDAICPFTFNSRDIVVSLPDGGLAQVFINNSGVYAFGGNYAVYSVEAGVRFVRAGGAGGGGNAGGFYITGTTTICGDAFAHRSALFNFIDSHGNSISFTISLNDGACADDTVSCHMYCLTQGGGDACCYPCCEGGTNWFCAPEQVPTQIYLTITNGGGVPATCFDYGGGALALPRLRARNNGVCVQWGLSDLFDPPRAFGVLGNFWITCAGDVYQYETVAQATSADTSAEVAQWVQRTTTVTINSCSPLDVDIEITSGPCAGTILTLTE